MKPYHCPSTRPSKFLAPAIVCFCLWIKPLVADPETVTVPLEISPDKARSSVTFRDKGVDNAITGDALSVKNVAVTGNLADATVPGIKFASGDFWDKKLTLVNAWAADEIPTPLISATNTNNDGTAAAVDLTGAIGKENHPFGVEFSGGDFAITAHGGSSIAVGAPVVVVDQVDPYISVGPSSYGDAMLLSATSTEGSSAACGATEVGSGGSANNWAIFGVGNGAIAASAASASGVAYGVANLASSASANGWTILRSDSTDNVAATPKRTVIVAGGGSGCAIGVTIGGAVDAAVAIANNWTIDLPRNASLSAYGQYACAIGIADCAMDTGQTPVARNWTVSLHSGTVATAVGCDASSPVSVHLGTIGGGSGNNENFRVYLPDSGDVTVGAFKLKEESTSADGTTTLTVGNDQGAAKATYARAIALGPNFQLNVGRKPEMEDGFSAKAIGGKSPSAETNGNGTWETDASIASGGVASGGSVNLNIVGAVCEARLVGNTNGSIMRVDSGSTVNAFGPVEGFKRIELTDGSLTLMRAGTRVLEPGSLAAVNCDDKVTAVVGKIESAMAYVDPTRTDDKIATNVDIGGKFKNLFQGDKIALVAAAENVAKGKLTLAAGEKVVFGVDPQKSSGFPFARKSLGTLFLPVGSSADDASLVLVNNSIDIAPIDPSVKIPANTHFLLAQVPGNTECASVIFGSSLTGDTITSEKYPGVTMQKINGVTVTPAGTHDDWKDLSLYWLKAQDIQDPFSMNSGDKISVSGLVLGTGTLPPNTAPDFYRETVTSGSIAATTCATVAAIRGGIENRLSDVKGNSDDPFLQVFVSREHQDNHGGLGFTNKGRGLLLGLDFIKELSSGALFRYGTLTSFSGSRTTFSGPLAEHGKYDSQGLFFGGLFGAYESFSGEGLKTNVNLVAGGSYFRNELWRTDANDSRFAADFSGNGFYLNCEIIRNVIRANGWQLGPWFTASYNHTRQKAYGETGPVGFALSMSSVNFDTIDTVLGINAEREFHNVDVEGRRIRLFLKAGWRCNPGHSHSSCTAKIGMFDPFTPTIGSTTKHSFAATIGMRNKLNDHVEISANVSTILRKHYSYVNLSAGVGYSF